MLAVLRTVKTVVIIIIMSHALFVTSHYFFTPFLSRMLYRRILPIHCEQLKRVGGTHPDLAKVFEQGLGMTIRRSGKRFASLWPDLCHEQVSLSWVVRAAMLAYQSHNYVVLCLP